MKTIINVSTMTKKDQRYADPLSYMAAPYSEISNYFQDATYSLCDHDQSY